MDDEKSQADTPEEPFTIGKFRAEAHAREEEWRESGGGVDSPLPVAEYDFWQGDLNLLAPRANPLDEKIRLVCRRYALCDADERSRIRHSTSSDQFYTLLNFATRSAVFAGRNSDADLITDALTALAMIEQDRIDFREIFVGFGLLYHTASRIGCDAREMFLNAAALAETKVAEYFVIYTNLPPERRDISSALWFADVYTKDGFGFIEWGGQEYDTTIDLQSAILDIAKLVVSDLYYPDHITLGTHLPDVWLDGPDIATAQRILSSHHGTASLSARLRPDRHPDHESQSFLVFLVETTSEAEARTLLKIANKNHKRADRKQLALAKSRLFCFVVARSFTEGVEGYETNESLMRFSDGLAAILERWVGLEGRWGCDDS